MIVNIFGSPGSEFRIINAGLTLHGPVSDAYWVGEEGVELNLMLDPMAAQPSFQPLPDSMRELRVRGDATGTIAIIPPGVEVLVGTDSARVRLAEGEGEGEGEGAPRWERMLLRVHAYDSADINITCAPSALAKMLYVEASGFARVYCSKRAAREDTVGVDRLTLTTRDCASIHDFCGPARELSVVKMDPTCKVTGCPENARRRGRK